MAKIIESCVERDLVLADLRRTTDHGVEKPLASRDGILGR